MGAEFHAGSVNKNGGALQLKIALPKGRFMQDLNTMFSSLGLKLNGYDNASRSYRPSCPSKPELFMKVFQEKDIPVQVAVGNYDLGICGSDWIEELMARYTSSSIFKIKSLGSIKGHIYAAASLQSGMLSSGNGFKGFRLASEYPNIAEAYALKKHLGKFSIFPLWGSSEVYPPENADMVILPVYNGQNLKYSGLKALERLSRIEAFLVANSRSWAEKDLSPFLEIFSKDGFQDRAGNPPAVDEKEPPQQAMGESSRFGPDMLRIALPDGHQQKGTMSLLERAGISISGYKQPLLNRRLSFPIDGIAVKVIRPQDMPSQVALGNFDLAITGQDWLKEHLTVFPSSPVQEVIKLGVGKVRIVAAAGGDLKNKGLSRPELLPGTGQYRNLRVASEYVNIAEAYAREKHLNPYKVIPTWGASESFLPEDADLLIENIETGKTLQEHGLAVLDVLFESQACLIGSTKPLETEKTARADEIIERLKKVSEK